MTEEKYLERKLKKEIEKLGGECLKFYSPYRCGMPDRFLVLPEGLFYMVELKGSTGELSKLQEATISKLKRLKHKVYVVNSLQTLEYLLATIRGEIQDAIKSKLAT